MSKIYKYELDSFETELSLPVNSKILNVQIHGETPVLWAIVNPELPHEKVMIQGIYTGWDITNLNGEYLATCQFESGIVIHFFKVNTDGSIGEISHL